MSLSKIARRIFGSKYITLEDAGYLDSELKLTDAGRTALDHVVFEHFEDKLVEAAQDFIARRDAKKN